LNSGKNKRTVAVNLPTLRSCLSRIPSDKLQQIADNWGRIPGDGFGIGTSDTAPGTGSRHSASSAKRGGVAGGVESRLSKADLVATLMTVMRDPLLLWRALMNLPRTTRGLLWTIHGAGGSILVGETAESDSPSHAPLKLLPELLSLGMVISYPDDTAPKHHLLMIIPREVYLALNPPPAYANCLGEWLSILPIEDSDDDSQVLPTLWQIARNHDISVRHTQLVLKDLIRRTLVNGDYLRKTYQERLSTSEQQLLKILSIKDHPLGLEELRNEWLHFRWSVDILDMTDVLKKLQALGLLLVMGPKGEVSGRRIILPRDLAFVIRNNFARDYHTPFVLRRNFFVSEAAPRLDTPMEFTVARDLISLLAYVFSEDVSLLGSDPADPMSGRIHRKHWRRLAPELVYRGDDAIEYMNFLFRFARFEGVISKKGDKPALIDEGTPLLRDQYELGSRMLEYWLRSLDRDGKLLRDNDPTPKNVQATGSHQWQSRLCLLANLATIGVSRWMSIDSYVTAFLQTEAATVDSDAIFSPHATANLEEDTRNSIHSILNWIGIVRVASDRNGTAIFCVTPYGDSVLRTRKSPTAEPAARAESEVVVLANHEIMLPPDIDPAVRFRLCQFVERRGSHCVLTRDSIRRAMDNGWEARGIIDFLEAHSQSELPDNVVKFVTEVADRHGHIIINAGKRTVEARDGWLMTEIKARRTITPYIAESLSPKKAAITNGKDPRRLLILLRKAGYFPRWVSA